MKYFKISCILFSMLVISNTANAQWSMEPCWLEICGTDKCLEYDIDNNNIHNNSVSIIFIKCSRSKLEFSLIFAFEHFAF